jgi:hypothetical protein
LFRTVIAVTILAGSAAFLLSVGSADAKGPFSLRISGGDLVEPITIAGLIDDRGMFGPEIDDPLPHPDAIYTVEFFKVGDGQPGGAISYLPAHDGLPAAWHTDYGFYAVPGEFNESFTAFLPSDEAGTSALWYIVPGAALGLAVVGGGLGGRRLLTRRRA